MIDGEIRTVGSADPLGAEFAALLEDIPVELAVLSAEGEILFVNMEWRRFALANGFGDPRAGVRWNYFEVCRRAIRSGDGEVERLFGGLTAVARGDRQEFAANYKCDSPTEERWFRMQARRLEIAGQARILVVHEFLRQHALRAGSEALLQAIATLDRFNVMLASEAGAQEILQQLLEELQTRCDLLLAAVYATDRGGAFLVHFSSAGYRIPSQHHVLPLAGPGLMAECGRGGVPRYEASVEGSKSYLEGNNRVKSELAVPLYSAGRLVGVLNCESSEVDGIDSTARELVRRLGAQIALVLARARDHEELALLEARHRAIIENAADAIWLLDASGRVTTANQQLAELLGRPLESILGRRAGEVFPRELVESLPHVSTLQAAGSSNRREILLDTAVGSRYLDLVHFPLRDGRGEIFATGTIARDVTRSRQHSGELRRANRELLRLAATDELTGLMNRRAFRSLLQTELKRSLRSGSPLSVVMMDIDHFKNINDSLGHAAGDALLRRLAGLLQEALRDSDRAARYGGDEFAIALPETDAAGALTLANKLLKLIDTALGEAARPHATCSMGVATNRTGETADELLDRTDVALYESKRAGRNRVTAWRADADDPAADGA